MPSPTCKQKILCVFLKASYQIAGGCTKFRVNRRDKVDRAEESIGERGRDPVRSRPKPGW